MTFNPYDFMWFVTLASLSGLELYFGEKPHCSRAHWFISESYSDGHSPKQGVCLTLYCLSLQTIMLCNWNSFPKSHTHVYAGTVVNHGCQGDKCPLTLTRPLQPLKGSGGVCAHVPVTLSHHVLPQLAASLCAQHFHRITREVTGGRKRSKALHVPESRKLIQNDNDIQTQVQPFFY